MISKIVISVVIFAYVVECNIVQPSPKSENFAVNFPPHRNLLVGFGNKEHCAHANTTFGKRIFGDLQMYVVRFIKGGSFLHETTVQASYPTGGSSNKCNITQINVENVRKKCNCFNNSINMVEGGVGKTFFKINITSGRNCPIDHKVSCYTKC